MIAFVIRERGTRAQLGTVIALCERDAMTDAAKRWPGRTLYACVPYGVPA